MHLGILVLCLAVVVTAFVLPADKALARELGLRWHFYCFMDDIFGFKCASCALARSLASFTSGEVTKAFKYYPLGPTIFIYVCFQIPYRMGAAAKAPRAPSRHIRRVNATFTVIVVGLIVIDWLFLMGSPVI